MNSARRACRCMAWIAVGSLATLNAADVIPAVQPSLTMRQQVVAAVARDLRLDPGVVAQNLEMLTPVQQVPVPLRVRSVKRDFAPSTWLLRLDCNPESRCLPFAALLHATVLDPSNWRDLPPARSSVELDPAQHRFREPVAPVVRKGENVNVIEEFAQVKLTMKAVSIDSGEVGDSIRVRNASSHRVVKATVIGAGTARVQVER